MKVKDVIKVLQERLDPEDEIIIDWWDKECFARIWEMDDHLMDDYPPKDVWAKVVAEWDEWSAKGNNAITDEVWEWVNDALLEYIPNN